MLLLLLGCVPTEHPPASWPTDGCTATRVGQREVWLQQDDGVRLAVPLRQPEGCTGTVVMIPGGLQGGLELAEGAQADALLEAGLAVVAFDPRGRGESEGAEDANGSRGQDDLAALTRWAAAQGDPAQVLIFSRSFGAAMASGALARHGDLRPLAWLDYEGPCQVSADLEHASGDGPENLAALAEAAESPEAWWSEREPAGFIGSVAVPYWRLQGLPDHALGARIAHALTCTNGATSADGVWFNRLLLTLPTTEAQLTDQVIGGGLAPDEDYVTQTLVRMAGGGG